MAVALLGLALMRFLRQFIMNRLAFEGANHEENTDENEGNAQNLSHIQQHAGFESFLIVLDEFDKETGCKNTSHEHRQAERG